MSDREALTAALTFNRVDDTEWEFVVRDAARERLAQLPEKCEHGESEPHAMTGPSICPGNVYPPEMVERIAAVLFKHYPFPADPELDEAAAVAVLDALNGES